MTVRLVTCNNKDETNISIARTLRLPQIKLSSFAAMIAYTAKKNFVPAVDCLLRLEYHGRYQHFGMR